MIMSRCCKRTRGIAGIEVIYHENDEDVSIHINKIDEFLRNCLSPYVCVCVCVRVFVCVCMNIYICMCACAYICV